MTRLLEVEEELVTWKTHMLCFINTFLSIQTHLFSEVRHMLLVSSSKTADVFLEFR